MSIYSQSFKDFDKYVKNKNSTFNKVSNLINKDIKKILDVGCSSGYFGNYLKNKFNCEVWGLDINESDTQKAKKTLDKVITDDIETLNFKKTFKKNKFDLVLFLDVLEHLKNPNKALSKIKAILTPNGYVIASIPNIAHQTIRIQLLGGEWNYEDMGILDKTHLRFFNYQSIVKLFENTGYFINTIDHTVNVSPESLEESLREIGLSSTPKLVKLLSSTEAIVYQYIVKAGIKRPKEYKSRLKKESQLRLIDKWNKNWQNTRIIIEKQQKDINFLNKEIEKVLRSNIEYKKHNEHLQKDINFLNKEIEKIKIEQQNINQNLNKQLDVITSSRFYKFWKKSQTLKNNLSKPFNRG